MDVLDLEGIDDDLEPMETDLDRPMSRLSVMPDTERPTTNELRLGKKVLDLEKERDEVAAELRALKAKHVPATSTTIPVPDPSTLATTADEKLEIPQNLLPILNVMRHHISELTRDNQAMRYTFGLESMSPATATSSKITLDHSTSPSPVSHEVNLQDVVQRVRDLVKENEELGDMVLELGKVDVEEWEQALEDSKKVIASLDADLQHHADLVQQLRQELDTHKAQSTPSTRDRGLLSPPPRSQASGSQSSRGNRHGSGQRGGSDHRNDRHHDHGHGSGKGNGNDIGRRAGGQGQGQNHSHRDERATQLHQRDRDRDRDRDRHRDNEGREGAKEETKIKSQDKPPTLSIRGASGANAGGNGPLNDFGPGTRREDDRASKRRR